MLDHMAEREIDILLVEDNRGDVRLTREALSTTNLPNRLYAVTDGDEAIDFLKGRGEYASAPRPDIILLDLNLPRKHGIEVLREIKETEDLRRIPVIVLTTSDAPEDITMSYDLYANCYVRKPLDLGVFRNAIKKIDEFWGSVARLPMT